MKKAGFKKRQNSFNRRLDNGFAHQFSLSLGLATSSMHGRFCFHIGCYIPAAELYRRNTPDGEPNWVTDSLCALRGGLPQFENGDTASMHIRPFSEEPQKADKYVIQALETFAKVTKPDDILAAQTRRIGLFWCETPLAIIQCCIETNRGNRAKAAAIVRSQTDDTTLNPSHVTLVKDWAKTLKLM